MKRISLENFMQDKSKSIYYRVINNQVQVITAQALASHEHLIRGKSVPRFLIVTEPLPKPNLEK